MSVLRLSSQGPSGPRFLDDQCCGSRLNSEKEGSTVRRSSFGRGSEALSDVRIFEGREEHHCATEEFGCKFLLFELV